jgi:hypothetical protein
MPACTGEWQLPVSSPGDPLQVPATSLSLLMHAMLFLPVKNTKTNQAIHQFHP